ncbi:hypothetical protein THAOC_02942 [Thalassiosira oceanica]|uniref:Sulfatase N-terminal domain-containing protein n=1 Tax=Thalassiosira oceanica TaxID=159749 RepID=K0TD29_THAOC|nr:hypothetical protein THAOC_02942 [Thalassiosira oceanica]|eukprot:EJK75335.1 hypothetical protein THAOC_02942 [Thalassiosira oceanica]
MSGELDRTIVVVSGDHGENLGDNGFEGKGLPWQASVSVPLLIAGPGVARGHIHGGPVATLDLGGTFLDLAGVSRLAKGMTTMSLRRYFGWAFDDDTPNPRQHVSSGWDNWRLVVKWLPTPTPGEDGGADDMTSFKLICCRGRECPGSPPTALPYKPGGGTSSCCTTRYAILTTKCHSSMRGRMWCGSLFHCFQKDGVDDSRGVRLSMVQGRPKQTGSP